MPHRITISNGNETKIGGPNVPLHLKALPQDMKSSQGKMLHPGAKSASSRAHSGKIRNAARNGISNLKRLKNIQKWGSVNGDGEFIHVPPAVVGVGPNRTQKLNHQTELSNEGTIFDD